MLTMNTLIALVNVSIAMALLALGGAMLARAWTTIREWPVPALAAIAGMVLTIALIFFQLSLWRIDAAPALVDQTAVLTLGLRLACLVVVVALTRRVWRGQVLTARDRARLREMG